MNHIKQLAVLLACFVGGDFLSVLMQRKLPGNVLGMTLLFILLLFGIVKASHIERAADFMLQNMAFFFLPACLGILNIYHHIKGELLAIVAVCILTTFCTAAATALTVHIVLRLQRKTTKEAEKNA